MKTLWVTFLALLLLTPALLAGDVSLAWDASTTPNVQYKIYWGTITKTYTQNKIVGTGLTTTITGLNPGTYYFAATAFDPSGNESAYSNEVSAAVVSPLTLTNPTTTGIAGVAYSSKFTAAGGTSPYTYALESGSLPPGLTLNASTGAITGTPTTAGTYHFRGKATDSVTRTVSLDCTITISVGTPGALRITAQSSSLKWYGVVLMATTDQPAKAILRYQKIEPGAGWATVIATPTATKKQHRAVLYLPKGVAYYNYEWLVASAAGTEVTGGGTFQTR